MIYNQDDMNFYHSIVKRFFFFFFFTYAYSMLKHVCFNDARPLDRSRVIKV